MDDGLGDTAFLDQLAPRGTIDQPRERVEVA